MPISPSDTDVSIAVTVNDLYRMLARIDRQTQRREVNLVGVVAILLETPGPLFAGSVDQASGLDGVYRYPREWRYRQSDESFGLDGPTLRGPCAL